MAKKGAVQYTDIFASDVHYGLLELQEDFNKLDAVAQSFSKTITGTKARINVSIKQTTQALVENKQALVGTDSASTNAAEAIQKFSKAAEDNIRKTQALKEQQKALNGALDLTTASVDEIKAKIASLTKEYNSLGRATDADKAKMQSLSSEVRSLKITQDSLTSSLNKGKQAVQAAEGSYAAASKKLADLRKELRELPGAINKSTGEFDKSNPAVRKYIVEIEKLDRAVKKMDATMGNHQRKVGDYSGALNKAGNDLAGFLAGYLSVAGAMSLASAAFDKALQVDAITTSLEFIFKETGDAAERIEMLRDTAERLGLEFTSLALSYKSFAGAAVASNFPMKEADRLFQAVANASAKLKLSSEQTEGALNALQQMISKGNVQAEELRGQLGERIPGAFSIAARAMGVTETQLNKLLKDGEVLASDLLPKLATELDKTFSADPAENVDSLQSSVNRLKNTFTDAVEQGNVARFFKAIVDGALEVVKSINGIINSKSWKEFTDRLFTDRRVYEPSIALKKQFNATQKNNDANKKFATGFGDELPDNVATNYIQEDKLRGLGAERFNSYLEKIKDSSDKALAAYKKYDAAVKSGLLTEDSLTVKHYKSEFDKSKQYYDAVLGLQKKFGYDKAVNIEEETESERKKRLKAAAKARADRKREEAEALRDARREAAEQRRLVKEADDLLKAQTKIKVSGLDSKLTEDIASAPEYQKTDILIKYEKDKLLIIEDGIAQRKKLYNKDSADYVELEAERVKAVSDSQEAINKATEDGLKRQKALRDKYTALDAELSDVNRVGTQDKEVSAVKTKQFRGTPEEQEQQRSDALREIRRKALLEDLVLADLKFNHVEDKLEREKLIEIEKAKIVNELNRENYEHQVELNDRAKAHMAKAFDFLHENAQAIGNLFGTELGNVFATLTTDLENFLNGGKQGFQEWAEVAVASIEFINASMRAASEAKIHQLEADRDREIELAGNNKLARQKIEDDYNAKIKSEKKKQARANKAAAMIEIAINTAVAASKVVGQLGLFGLPLVPIILGLGAVQLALVAAKPIPEFWKGTDNAPEGWAHLAERGPEIVETPKGERKLIKDPTIGYLKKGSKVFTASQTAKMLQDLNLHQNSDLHADLSKTISIGKRNQEIQVMAAAMNLARTDERKIGEEVGKRLADLPMNIHHFDEQGYSRAVRKGNSTVKLLNDKYSL